MEGGAWHCGRHGVALTRCDQDAGCAAHLYVPDLVPGEQVDAGEDWVSYRLRDGSEWRDGVPERPSTVSHLPCRVCRGTIYRVGPGKGPHIAELICTSCNTGGRWLSKADALAMGVAA